MDTLLGITTHDWARLLKENKLAVSPRYWNRAATLTVMSVINSVYKRREEEQYAQAMNGVQIEPPIFILGHWRSGTTLLTHLLSLDEQFEYPNLFQVSHPHTFLSREKDVEKQLAGESADQRPMDNVRVTYRSPGEDEFAVALSSLRSPVIGWSFPQREKYYDRFLTFEGVKAADLARWQEALVTFLQKLTWRYRRSLLLKSPPHTARIRLLLEMFPQARFIHIRRNPYDVFRSTQRLYETAVPQSYLQQPNGNDVTAGILRRYTQMYDAFFAERPLIPDGQFHEIAFEDLEQDMVGELGKAYDSLDLTGFANVRPAIEQYAAETANYKKNAHPPLAEPLRQRVTQAWRRNFEVWDYYN